MSELLVPVSYGELLDKIAILQIKSERMSDPAKLAKALMQLAAAANPPLRLPLGSDTVQRIEAKNRQVAAELDSWRELALSTDF